MDTSHCSGILYHIRGKNRASKTLCLNKYIVIGFAGTMYQTEIKHILIVSNAGIKTVASVFIPILSVITVLIPLRTA